MRCASHFTGYATRTIITIRGDIFSMFRHDAMLPARHVAEWGSLLCRAAKEGQIAAQECVDRHLQAIILRQYDRGVR